MLSSWKYLLYPCNVCGPIICACVDADWSFCNLLRYGMNCCCLIFSQHRQWNHCRNFWTSKAFAYFEEEYCQSNQNQPTKQQQKNFLPPCIGICPYTNCNCSSIINCSMNGFCMHFFSLLKGDYRPGHFLSSAVKFHSLLLLKLLNYLHVYKCIMQL